MPSLLFLTQRIPYPPTKGEKIRAWQIFNHLRKSYDIHLGSLVDDPLDQVHVGTVRALCDDAYFATLDRRRAKVACLRGLLTGEPLSVTFYRDHGLAAWVNRVLAEVRPEVVFVCSSNMAPYVLQANDRGRVCLVDLVDVDSEKWRDYAHYGSAAMRWVHRREWRRTAALERRIAQQSDWSTLVSPAEAQLFTRLVPEQAARIKAVSNGVDHQFFDPAPIAGEVAPFDTTRRNYVFTGTMDYPPNVDAVKWFAESILPLVHRNDPDAQFQIVGSNPAPAVQTLAGNKGVFVTGRVADVRPYLRHAAAAVAPMRIARGIQNKVLEAMAMARPVVVTPEALEGIDAAAGVEVVLARDPHAFAAGCAYAVGPEGAAIGLAARRRVLADYVWSERLRGFDALLRPLAVADIAPVAGDAPVGAA